MCPPRIFFSELGFGDLILKQFQDCRLGSESKLASRKWVAMSETRDPSDIRHALRKALSFRHSERATQK